MGIVDEYHAHKENQMYKLLKGGTRHLPQSLVSVITTAGFNLNDPCYELYKYCHRVLRGIDANERQFVYIAQMDEKDDIWDERNWIKCCPLSGHNPELVSQMMDDARKAKSMGGAELLTVTAAASGIKTDYKAILAHLRMVVDVYDIDLVAIAYDPANSGAFVSDLEDFGCDLVSVTQSAMSLNDATVDFALEVKAHNMEYDERNRLLTRSMNDAILSDPNSFGEVKIDKMRQKARIDPCDAAICAHKVAMGAEIEAVTTDMGVEA